MATSGLTPEFARQPLVRQLGVLAGVGAAYYAVARASLELALVGTNVTPLWPPTGIAVVALFVLGPRAWPAVAAGAFLVNAPISGSVVDAAAVAAGNTLAPLAAAALLRRARFDPHLGRRRDAVAIVLCALLSMVVSATVGSVALVASDVVSSHQFWNSWWVWWAGDAMGVLAVAPLLWALLRLGERPQVVWWRLLEGVASLGVLSVVTWFAVHSTMSRSFVILPLVGLVAWRFQQAGAAPAAFIVSTMAAWAAAERVGLFAGQSVPQMMLTLQAFNASVALSSFYFAAAVTEQRRIAGALRQVERDRRAEALARAQAETQRLEEIFRRAPAGVVLTSGPDHVIEFANPAFVAAVGGSPDCIGQPARRALPHLAGDGYFELLDRVFTTGEAYAANQTLLRPAVGEGRDGTFFNLVYQPVRDDEGRIAGIFGHEVDVTDMVLARREVEALAAQLSRLYDREHQVAETLQRSFLPARLPEVEGTSFAARYVAGSREADVGGDWYDAVAGPDGRVMLVIGDVEGRGVEAAAAMSQLRNSLRAYVFDGAGPAEALTRLSRLVQRSGEERFATVLCVALREDGDEVCYARAGHLPALVVRADGTTEYLDQALSPPIGATEEAPVVEAQTVLDAGSTLVLYTDGLVERHDATIEDGLSRLAEVAAGARGDAVDLVARLVEEVGGEDLDDDVAILAVRREAAGGGLRLRLPTTPASAAELRRRLEPYLRRLGLPGGDVRDVLLATSEAASNAIEHPQAPRDDHFEVTADAIGGELRVVVRDFGRWKHPDHPTERGRGLPLMKALMRVDVVAGPAGTEVTLRTPVPVSGAPSVRRSVGAEPAVAPPVELDGGREARD